MAVHGSTLQGLAHLKSLQAEGTVTLSESDYWDVDGTIYRWVAASLNFFTVPDYQGSVPAYPGRPLSETEIEQVRSLVAADMAPAPISFSYGDATPSILQELADAAFCGRVRVVIDVPFDGAGAALALGVTSDVDAMLTTDDIDPTAVGSYDAMFDDTVAAGEAILLSITPGAGATQGSGKVVLELFSAT